MTKIIFSSSNIFFSLQSGKSITVGVTRKTNTSVYPENETDNAFFRGSSASRTSITAKFATNCVDLGVLGEDPKKKVSKSVNVFELLMPKAAFQTLPPELKWEIKIVLCGRKCTTSFYSLQKILYLISQYSE